MFISNGRRAKRILHDMRDQRKAKSAHFQSTFWHNRAHHTLSHTPAL
jgi:hypothetical protein